MDNPTIYDILKSFTTDTPLVKYENVIKFLYGKGLIKRDRVNHKYLITTYGHETIAKYGRSVSQSKNTKNYSRITKD